MWHQILSPYTYSLPLHFISSYTPPCPTIHPTNPIILLPPRIYYLFIPSFITAILLDASNVFMWHLWDRKFKRKTTQHLTLGHIRRNIYVISEVIYSLTQAPQRTSRFMNANLYSSPDISSKFHIRSPSESTQEFYYYISLLASAWFPHEMNPQNIVAYI